MGRFINADGIIGANGGLPGYNLFAYCNNNPVMGYDPLDEWDWGSVFSTALVITAVVAVTVAVVAATVVTCGAAAPVLATAGVAVTSTAAATSTLTSEAVTSTYVAGTCLVAAVTVEVVDDVVTYAKDSYDPDPYKRPGQNSKGERTKINPETNQAGNRVIIGAMVNLEKLQSIRLAMTTENSKKGAEYECMEIQEMDNLINFKLQKRGASAL